MDISPMLECLRAANCKTDKVKAINSILDVFEGTQKEEETDDIAERLTSEGILDDLINVSGDEDTLASVGQLLAELAKNESVRVPCVEKGFIPILLKVLERQDDIDRMTQACRALGNICFDNDIGRAKVDEDDGISILLTLLNSLLGNTKSGTDKLRTIACGFLLNLTNSNETLQKKALEEDALNLIAKYLKNYETDERLCNMVLLTIASLTDSEMCKEKLFASNLCQSMVDFLQTPTGEDQYESVLDILITLSEWDEVKDLLAQTDLCKQLIKMAQVTLGENAEYSEDNQQKVKMSSDLLILLLTGEKSMEILFDGGKGEIFSESMTWLDSDEQHLQLCGALAVGNFARSDEHCQFLVEQGVIKRLLRLLKPVYGEQKCTLEHASLSALRNLAIPAGNKASLIKEGVIDAVLVLVDSEMLAVIFKMLGVLRMLVDGQDDAAVKLGQHREFVTRLVEWSACEEHPGVKGEATRLMAWLVKNSRAEDVMRNIIRADGIPFLVAMATSEHIVMQNESLVALTLIASTVLADAALPLKEADILDTITQLLKADETLPEIKCNTLTLTRTICSSEALREDLLSSSIPDVIRQLTEHDDEKVKIAAKSVIPVLEDTQPVDR
ncbi:rap1 GTPase-GDP dissociation stimulator 1-like isoform X2 [Ruditapes philippinarum]|uniref:rap1 GTPase-GDP dissociation stimulator 1-like isoform X2 n=1 Tax=Ruditapes philippinarum TaxID=129788 RepID=UPI00295C2FAF|nr:rap1 GTPase-GDP dissociation stimulator 1-like isoform X2 [Ruditapes philippinarum]